MKTASGSWNVHQSPAALPQGDTRDSAIENVRDAIKVCLEVRAERGMPLTVETQQVEVMV